MRPTYESRSRGVAGRSRRADITYLVLRAGFLANPWLPGTTDGPSTKVYGPGTSD